MPEMKPEDYWRDQHKQVVKALKDDPENDRLIARRDKIVAMFPDLGHSHEREAKQDSQPS